MNQREEIKWIVDKHLEKDYLTRRNELLEEIDKVFEEEEKEEYNTFEEVYEKWCDKHQMHFMPSLFIFRDTELANKTAISIKALAIIAEVLNDGEEGNGMLAWETEGYRWLYNRKIGYKYGVPLFKDEDTALKAGKIIETIPEA
jgi:hypothetical protein